MTTMIPRFRFTLDDAERAYAEWGAGFERQRYTTPSLNVAHPGRHRRHQLAKTRSPWFPGTRGDSPPTTPPPPTDTPDTGHAMPAG